MLTAENLSPVSEFQVGGDDQGDPFVQGGTELEHQLGAGSRERDEAQLIQDNEVLFEGGGQEFRQALLFLSQHEFVDQGCGVVKAHSIALSAGRQGQSRSDVTFP